MNVEALLLRDELERDAKLLAECTQVLVTPPMRYETFPVTSIEAPYLVEYPSWTH